MDKYAKEEAPALTLDEIAQIAATAYLNKKAQEDTARNEKLKEVLEHTDAHSPEKTADFLSNIPEMHLSWRAIRQIDQNQKFARLYCMVMLKIYDGKLPLEIETILASADDDNLIKEFTRQGLVWSSRAKNIIERLHPRTYEKVFEKRYCSNGYDQ